VGNATLVGAVVSIATAAVLYFMRPAVDLPALSFESGGRVGVRFE
jgi:hypothetical protein